MNKIFSNRRGAAEEGFLAVYIVGVIGILALMFLFLRFLPGSYLDAYLTYSPEVKQGVFAYRAINNCLAYQDPVTKRFYPGIIDTSKYTKEKLDECYQGDDVSISFSLTDRDSQKEYGKILVGFGASLRQETYDVLILPENGGEYHKATLVVGVS